MKREFMEDKGTPLFCRFVAADIIVLFLHLSCFGSWEIFELHGAEKLFNSEIKSDLFYRH